MNTDSDIYKMPAAVNNARKSTQSYNSDFQEKYVLDNFYAFSRGDMLVALTNSHNQQQIAIPNTPWSDGTTVCNIFYPDSDCQTISNKTINVTLANGENKIYVPKSSLEQTQEIIIQ